MVQKMIDQHNMRIEPLDPARPDAVHLIALSDAYMTALYPSVSNHLDGVVALQQANVSFFGGYIDRQLVACGAAKVRTDDGIYAEVKRLFLLDTYRGQGLSKAIMDHLEQHVTMLDIGTMRLETGIYQPEALRLYARLGYRMRGPFGPYTSDPFSVFMEKKLAQRFDEQHLRQ